MSQSHSKLVPSPSTLPGHARHGVRNAGSLDTIDAPRHWADRSKAPPWWTEITGLPVSMYTEQERLFTWDTERKPSPQLDFSEYI